jgi:hypothetical protein
MFPLVSSTSLTRRFRQVGVVAPVLIVALASGCHSQRSSMRPVYVSPGGTVVPTQAPGGCASGNCGSTSTSPSTSSSTSTTVPVPKSAPGFDEEGSALTPIPGHVNPTPSGSGSPPPNPPVPDEPPLRTTPGAGSSGKTGSATPALNGPTTYRYKSPSPTSTRLTARDRVEPFVNDPSDLFQPPKADRPWRYIVLHHSAHEKGAYAQIDRDHRKTMGTQGCGYHFVIGNGSESPDGQIEVARRWSDQKGGAHCRDAQKSEMNDYGIGICLIGDLDHNKPTPRQIEATRVLVSYLRTRYGISIEQTGTHAMLAQSPTACPGKNFPVAEILGNRRSFAAL